MCDSECDNNQIENPEDQLKINQIEDMVPSFEGSNNKNTSMCKLYDSALQGN